MITIVIPVKKRIVIIKRKGEKSVNIISVKKLKLFSF